MKPAVLAFALAGAFGGSIPSFAMENGEHGGQLFHVVRAELDATDTQWLDRNDGALFTWDASAWYGGDREKLWLRSEGEILAGDIEQAEFWALYSRNIAEFWDFQAGLRYDFEPGNTAYLAIGFEGLATYFFETGAHAFVSENGDISARLAQSIDILITQRLIAEPHAELNLYAGDVPELGVGAGASDIELGLQTRYEITRQFAPYLDLVYERALGETAGIARAAGGDPESVTLRLGLRVWF